MRYEWNNYENYWLTDANVAYKMKHKHERSIKTTGTATTTKFIICFTYEKSIKTSGNMDHKTPISFNLRKHVGKHCNGP